ncbi:Heat shock protein HSP70 [Ceratobasidium theobromae]|uniref:Heat shock protein HSP70 n=1 Tax=Ceratobasidium theobromae TaxID=1582974 RepID=A0A5N5QMU0_9AGAM|nr:Heat shock protein HSP70 [Ceratobasidium theobromae]
MPPATTDPVPRLFTGEWQGEDRIVVGIDIGTTQSGVAFAFLENGSQQTIHRVTQWPGQQVTSLQSKIPSLIWYNENKEAVAIGAEALLPQIEERAEDEGWSLARHFKLHMHPSNMQTEYNLQLDALPVGVSRLQIYTDFLKYLLKHTKAYFEDRIVDGRHIWEKYRESTQFIIAHPNGWGTREQKFLRTAAVKAELTTEATARANIRFVTEAEASVHFCMHHTNLGSRLQPGMKFGVSDAGGSTVDTTIYTVISARPPLKLEEARASACVQAGAIFVNAAAEKHIHDTLVNGDVDEEDVKDYTKRGVDDFEKNLKRNFHDATEDKSIEVAGPRVNYPGLRIRRGRMTLPGELDRAVVKSIFDVCVDKIKVSVGQQMQGMDVAHLLLVGGFGDSPYLRQVFKDQYEPSGCQITLANDSTSKAVADGAIIWSTTDSVAGRAPRFSYGIETSIRYNPATPDHRGRDVIPSADGNDKVHGIWSLIAPKDVTLDTRAVARESFSRAFSTPNPDLDNFEIPLFAYSKARALTWMRERNGRLADGVQPSCVISANLASLGGALEPRIGTNGAMYWRLYFEVCMRFGGTEFEAFLEWEEGGGVRTSDAEIVPDDEVEDS